MPQWIPRFLAKRVMQRIPNAHLVRFWKSNTSSLVRQSLISPCTRYEYEVLLHVVLWLVRICIPSTQDLMFPWVSCAVAVLTETLTASVLRCCLLIFWPHNVTLSGPPPVQIATACNIVTRRPWHSVMRCSLFSGCPSQLLCSNH